MQEWKIEWGYGAKAILRLIPWRQAERVDATVQRFARTGAGRVEWVGGSRRYARLRVPPFVVQIEIDDIAGVIRVWGISRTKSEG